MEQALYHPEHGYYGSGHCAIGRRGDYFTSVSVGPLFGTLMAGQFAEIWEKLGRARRFRDRRAGRASRRVCDRCAGSAPRLHPEFFAVLRYRIVEPFSTFRQRQQGVLRPFVEKTESAVSLEEMETFCGVHFSNELLDAMPVHLLIAAGDEEDGDGMSDWSSANPAVLRLSIGRSRMRDCWSGSPRFLPLRRAI